MTKHIRPHQHSIERQRRSEIKGHRSVVLWFTGLSGSGKSTIANAVEKELNQKYRAHTYLLDGDNIRTGLNKDLSFSAEDRSENIRRIGEVARLFVDAGLIVLTAFISPFREDRKVVRDLLGNGDFVEIFVHCPLEVCEQRDPKGLYQKARLGEIQNFTGINSPYEAPDSPELTLDSSVLTVEECVEQVIQYLKSQSLLSD